MAIKLGLGLHRWRISPENFRFARQAGCTHAVVHLVDRFKGVPLPRADETCFGMTRAQGRLWAEDELRDVKQMAEAEGLQLEAVENIDPSFWSDVLLGRAQARPQLEGLKTLIRRLGKVGIPILGYNFSLAGVWGRVEGPYARGGAVSTAFIKSRRLPETPLPEGQLCNIVYDLQAPDRDLEPISREALWERLGLFLRELVPVAEESGVRLAAHPDDPPVPTLRHTPRLIHLPQHYQELLDLVPSPANAIEFCVGTTQEMAGANLYEAIDQYSRQGSIAYVHCRNVRGKVPRYTEVFIDEGDVDMLRVLRILKTNGFDGAVIPDHTPQMTCPAPWHAGMAHALGYLRAALMAIESA